jgi:tripartite-type tricarboxylate transporter receptor subunit TctC
VRPSRRLILALPAVPAPARAASFPDRPVRLVIGYPAGGGTDVQVRPIAARLQAKLGVPVLVENRPGANGNIAMEQAARAEPDGHTLFVGDAGNLAMTHALHPNLPFDTQRDFVAVAQLTAGPVVFVVPADLPAPDMAGLLALARARPGRLHFASGGVGSTPHLFWEEWRGIAGVETLHVPYTGSGPALQGLLAGDVQLMIANHGVFRGAAEAGLARVLGISSPVRHPALPEVPTLRETGTDWSRVSFIGVVAPARLPAARREMLEAAFRAVLEEEALGRTVLDLGSFAAFAPGAALDRHMREQRALWTRIVREAQLRLG